MSTQTVTITGPAGCCCRPPTCTGCCPCGAPFSFANITPSPPALVVAFRATGCAGDNIGGATPYYQYQPPPAGPPYPGYGWPWVDDTGTAFFFFHLSCTDSGFLPLFRVSDQSAAAAADNSLYCGGASNHLGDVVGADGTSATTYTTAGPVCDSHGFVSQSWVADFGVYGTWTVTVAAAQ